MNNHGETWNWIEESDRFRVGQLVEYRDVEATIGAIGGSIILLTGYTINGSYENGGEIGDVLGLVNDERYNWKCHPAFAVAGGIDNIKILSEPGCDECMSCINGCKGDIPCDFREAR